MATFHVFLVFRSFRKKNQYESGTVGRSLLTADFFAKCTVKENRIFGPA